MDFKEQVYSVLVVSAAENFNNSLISLLPETRYSPIHIVKDIALAKRAFAERTFDFVIINAPLPDDMGTRFAIDVSSSKSSVALLLVRSEIHEEVHDKVSQYGVFTLPKPTSKLTLTQAFFWLESARGRLYKFEKKTLSIEEKMEEIRLVNRAKWLLISELKMDEENAHRYIEKQSMSRCISKKEMAQIIIKTYSQ